MALRSSRAFLLILGNVVVNAVVVIVVVPVVVDAIVVVVVVVEVVVVVGLVVVLLLSLLLLSTSSLVMALMTMLYVMLSMMSLSCRYVVAASRFWRDVITTRDVTRLKVVVNVLIVSSILFDDEASVALPAGSKLPTRSGSSSRSIFQMVEDVDQV